MPSRFRDERKRYTYVHTYRTRGRSSRVFESAAVGQALPCPLRPTISVLCAPCAGFRRDDPLVRVATKTCRNRRRRHRPLLRWLPKCRLEGSASFPDLPAVPAYLVRLSNLALEPAHGTYRNFQHLLVSAGFVCFRLSAVCFDVTHCRPHN